MCTSHMLKETQCCGALRGGARGQVRRATRKGGNRQAAQAAEQQRANERSIKDGEVTPQAQRKLLLL